MFVEQAAFFVGFLSHLSRCSTLTIPLQVGSPKALVVSQEHRLALNHTSTRKRRRRTRCLYCTAGAAVALAVSGPSMCEADDLDDGATRAAGPTVDGEVVVLSDWLEKSRQEGRVEVISSFEEQREGGRDSSPPHRFQELIQVGKTTAVLYV